MAASCQAASPSSSSSSADIKEVFNGPGISSLEDSPVAQVRKDRSWEYAPFINYGNGVGGDRSNYHFLSLGVEAGKVLTPVLHAGFLSGQFQYAVNIMPLWQVYTPAPHNQIFVYKGVTYDLPIGGGTYTGFSLTPVIFRWNFLTHSRRVQPWFQGAGGLITPPINFRRMCWCRTASGRDFGLELLPQAGIGMHYFTRDKRSVDLSLECRTYLVGVFG